MDHAAQLRRSREEFERRGTRIVLVTFGHAGWARMWKEQTGTPFEILLDPEKRAYRAFGLERSWFRVFDARTLARYARHLIGGKLPPRGHGDRFQLGGDFVVDPERAVRYAHRCRTPSDRPPVEEILAAIDELESAPGPDPVPR